MYGRRWVNYCSRQLRPLEVSGSEVSEELLEALHAVWVSVVVRLEGAVLAAQLAATVAAAEAARVELALLRRDHTAVDPVPALGAPEMSEAFSCILSVR